MITEKDFKYVGIRYRNKLSAALEPNYDYNDITYLNGGCSLTRLRNPFTRFWVGWFSPVNTDFLTDKKYTNRVLKLTCSKEKLEGLTPEESAALKDKVVKTIKSWKLDIQDVLIYPI
jgi:hypothetical protein